MERPGPAPDVTPDDVLGVFERLDDPCTPLTASEVAGALDCSRRTAHRKLEALADRADVESKKTGARGRIWWRPCRTTSGDGPPRTAVPGGPTDESRSTERYDVVVGDDSDHCYVVYSPGDEDRTPAKPVDTRAVLERVLDGHRERIVDAGASVRVGDLPTLAADRARIERLFRTCVSSALESDHPGIVIDAVERDDGWWFRVSQGPSRVEPDRFARAVEFVRSIGAPAADTTGGTRPTLVARHAEETGESDGTDGSAFFFTVRPGDEP